MTTASQTFQDHIHELRSRLFAVLIAVGISASLAYAFRNPVIELLHQPLDAPLFYSSPAGGFDFVIKLSVIIGLFVALPVLVYQMVRFLAPAMPFEVSKGKTLRIMGSSILLAAGGAAFAFFVIIPQSLKFFGGYSTAEIKPLISADSYLSFVINTMITFAIAFQIPLFILFINWIKPLRPQKLLKYQRHVIVFAFGISVILPFTYDPISQFLVAVPIIVLFYLSALLLVIANRKSKTASAVPKPAVAEQLNQPTPLPLEPARRPALSMDGMRRSLPSPQPAAAARVAPAPSTSRPISRPGGRTATSKQQLSVDGFFRPATSA